MNEELIRELMKDIEGMAMQIEGEWGSPDTTLEEMIAGAGWMPDSYYKLLELLAPYEALFTATND